MNILEGTIQSIYQKEKLLYLKVNVKDETFGILMIECFQEFKEGIEVQLLFKETEVMIALPTARVSARVASIAPIIDIIKGDILWDISLDFKGVVIHSLITAEAALELNIMQNMSVLWFVQSTEVILKHSGADFE